MAESVACRSCGVRILPVTATRTGGLCMPCSRHPRGPAVEASGAPFVECHACGAAILEATAAHTGGRCIPCVRTGRLAARAPTAELVTVLDRQVQERTLRAARHAAASYAGEGIYGFFLFGEHFAMFSTAVFTEATLDATLVTLGLSPDSPDRGANRWTWERELPHGTEFDDAELRLTVHALEEQAEDDGDSLCEIEERAAFRALLRVREEAVFEPRVLLSIGAFDQADEEILAYAEAFNDAALVEAFKREARDLNDDHIRQYRQRIQATLAGL